MDLNNVIRPDYMLGEIHEGQQQLIDEGLTEAQAIQFLTMLWNVNNNTEKAHWRAEEDDIQRQQDLKDKEEAVHLEDRKKNKNKYAPFKYIKVPSNPTILPAQYAIRRLKAGDYCKLHYFTNKGLDDTTAAALVAKPNALVMLPAMDGIHS
ncbi:hypothetical protein BDR05DRAFT_952128 [Suillus weaverae]|nr:hypothetical protein BDR05DRAFT_952128 [Suillus weaverae]